MAVPGYQEFMLPLLRIAGDRQEHTTSQTLDLLAEQLGISAEDRQAMLPSGSQTRFTNRVSWAIVYLTKSLLLEKAGKGRFRITSRGLEVLNTNPPRIDNGCHLIDHIALQTGTHAQRVVMFFGNRPEG
jgi:restriction system protein